MASAEDRTFGLRAGSPPEGIGRELLILLMGLATSRRMAGDKIRALEEAGLNDPLDLEQKRNAIRLEAAEEALLWAIGFIQSATVCEWQPAILERELGHHLNDLREALGDLRTGSSPGLFDLAPQGNGKKRVAPRSDQELRGKIAACAEVLTRAGMTLEDACSQVAQLLSLQGHRKKYARKSERAHDLTITPGTVRGWRKKAIEGDPGSPLTVTFRRWLALAEQRHREAGESYSVIGIKLVNMLAHMNRGGRDLVIPLRDDFGRKSTNGR
jgi:hypothetical protein